MKQQLPKAICFDLDGVLVDATEWHFQAFNDALGLFGYSIGRDDHINVYNGLPSKEKLKIMAEKGIIPTGVHNVILEQKKNNTNRLISNNCRPMYDKILMLRWLKSQGVKLACCSNAIQESVENMLELSMIAEYFDVIIGNDKGFKPKPAPDIYYEAFIELFGTHMEGENAIMNGDAEDVWIVEDAPHGIEAAKASGAGRVIEVGGFEEVNLSLFI